MSRFMVTTEIRDFILGMDSQVITRDGAKYHYMPFWFKEDGEDSEGYYFDALLWDDLPDELRDRIRAMSDGE